MTIHLVYLLDGDICFGMAQSLMPVLNWLSKVPQMIVVGIGYGIQKSYNEWSGVRELDFNAPPDRHADRFLAALKEEIIPFVESEYRTKPDTRILYGCSWAGFFVLYALANEPGLFRTYITNSGYTTLSSKYVPSHDQKLVSREKTPPIDLFLSIGSIETIATGSTPASFQELVDAIQKKNYPGVRLVTEVCENESHGAVGLATSYCHGLQKCFPTVNS